MFSVFQFTFSNSNDQNHFTESQSEKIRLALKSLHCHELLLIPHAGGCDAFMCVEERLPSKNAIWQVIADFLALPNDRSVECKILEENEAATAFFMSASGIHKEAAGHTNGERFRYYFQLASEASVTGPILQHLFQRSLWLHEKIRLETEYFRFAIDEPAVLRELVSKIFGAIKTTKILLIGSSPLLIKILKELHRAGSHEIAFAGTDAQYADLKKSLDFAVRNSGNKAMSIENSDILLVAETASDQLSLNTITRRMSRRKNAPLAIFSESRELYSKISEKRIYNVFDFSIDNLERSIKHNLREQHATLQKISHWIEQEVSEFHEWLASDLRYQFAGMIGSTPEMHRVFELISRIAQTDITVLIQAESGTGKELVARAIHRLSARSEYPFVVVNCGAIPENLLESELFGHERGAFTGAITSKTGLFREADGGTILLDEIGELPPHLQVKLLRFLQEGEIKPVGSNDTRKVNVRVLAATNQNLEKMLETGEFRSDLYFRLNVIRILLPPLRERKADIPLLAQHFLYKFSQKFHKDVQEISSDAMMILKTYAWPGNVRELENAIEHSVALCIGNVVNDCDLPRTEQQDVQQNGRMIPIKHLSLKEVEKRHILETLEICQGNYDEASKILGIGRTTLWRKLREYEPQNPT